jgi:hypothetical protein
MSQTVNVKVNGVAEVQAALRAFGKTVEDQVSKAIEATALEALTDVRKAIQGPPKTGRIYTKENGIKHQASAAGEAPATDNSALVTSTYITKVNSITWAIGSRLPYAFMLEFGTLKIEPRPAWMPAAERAAPRGEKRIDRIIAQAKAQAEKTTK